MPRLVEIPVFYSPSGEVVAVTITFKLVDLNNKAVLGVDNNGLPIIDSAEIVTTALPQTLALTPTDTISPPARYLITIVSPERKCALAYKFYSHILSDLDPLNPTVMPWEELILFEAGLERGDILLNRLPPDPTGVPDGSVLMVLNSGFVFSLPSFGAGDMLSLIYDPRGVQADAFDAANLTGEIDGGIFT